MVKTLEEILKICESKITDTIYAINCNIMHERQGRGIDYSIYSEVLGNANIVKQEIEWYRDNIKAIISNIELSLLGEWQNPFIEDDWHGTFDDNDKKKDVYDYLLDRYFNDNEVLIMTEPSKFVLPFIEQNFVVKKLMREGLKKFFPDLVFKKMSKTETGELVISDFTKIDEGNAISDNELEKISLTTKFENFVENAKVLLQMLKSKSDLSEILIFIRDN